MEKRKDIDMLRFYGGDIHQKNKEGEYVITNNLVNPKNKEDMLWGDRDAYRTLNGVNVHLDGNGRLEKRNRIIQKLIALLVRCF